MGCLIDFLVKMRARFRFKKRDRFWVRFFAFLEIPYTRSHGVPSFA